MQLHVHIHIYSYCTDPQLPPKLHGDSLMQVVVSLSPASVLCLAILCSLQLAWLMHNSVLKLATLHSIQVFTAPQATHC